MVDFDIVGFAKDVHENAVAHGWWEEERSAEEIIALIHSEWSEALEEYRAGRPLTWHKCPYGGGACENQEVHQGQHECATCAPYKRKPEGAAVELIDGCIRILDYLEHECVEMPERVVLDEFRQAYFPKLPDLVCALHGMTAKSLIEDEIGYLGAAMCVAMFWVKEQGIDPVEVIKEKHEYNKTRPYKHGGKVC